MLAGLFVAVITNSAFAGSPAKCIKSGGYVTCTEDATHADRKAARGVHSGGKEELVDGHLSQCPPGVPPDGKVHKVQCSTSQSGWCKQRCGSNGS